MSLAVCDSIDAIVPKARLFIKWPNDIYWGDKKLAGILLETVSLRPGFIIVGFGVNINISSGAFPSAIRDIATSVLVETGKPCSVGAVLCATLDRFWHYLSLSPAAAHALYSGRLYKIGETCMVGNARGRFKNVVEDGRMCLQTNGSDCLITSGPVRF